MGVTIDITGTTDVTFAPSPLGELAAMLHALAEPGHHGRLISGVDVEDALRRRIDDSALLWRSSRADFLLPGRPAETLGEELDVVDRLDDEAFVASALLTTSCGAVPHVRGASPLVDATTTPPSSVRDGGRCDPVSSPMRATRQTCGTAGGRTGPCKPCRLRRGSPRTDGASRSTGSRTTPPSQGVPG